MNEVNQQKETTSPSLLRHALLFSFGVVCAIMVLCVILGSQYLSIFSQSSGLSRSSIWTTATASYTKRSEFADKKITFLILGLDKREDQYERTLLTDTIILASLDTQDGELTMLPIPRDLWIPELQTKVNALYFYGEDRPETTGPDFSVTEISRITGRPIDYYFVLNYQYLPELIDAVGGVEVMVKQRFTDHYYPNPHYVLEASDSGEPVYLSIVFDAGKQWMRGERALQFVRSRGSSDPEEGSDLARSERQTLVVQALIARLKQRQTLLNPEALGLVYRFWKTRVITNLTDNEIGALGLILFDKQLSFSSIPIPTVASGDQSAILTNPPISKYGLWVWEPVDPTWKELQEFVQTSL